MIAYDRQLCTRGCFCTLSNVRKVNYAAKEKWGVGERRLSGVNTLGGGERSTLLHRGGDTTPYLFFFTPTPSNVEVFVYTAYKN